MSSPALPDDDITKLRREDLQIVLAWAQDRLLNAITPLDARLQMESPGVMACDKALQAGVHTCRKIRAAVDELKAAAAAGRA
jgi:hypothetical protein